MIEETIDDKELAFAAELEGYENRWVAILDYGGDGERIVASGGSLREARREADTKGFGDATFFKVPPSGKVFVP